MNREHVDSSSFFTRMEQFGFFDHVEKDLPDNFTTVFEIARVLEDPEHPLAQKLAPIMWQNDANRPDTQDKYLIPHVTVSDEYEADLIRTVREVVRIYPHQFLLPDEVFYRKLAERSLWMPRPKAPNNYRYQSESDSFAPDIRKQKVYILFDTSSSMQMHYRIHLAKAIAFFFLKENVKELGTIFFRTFDAAIGELHTASDIPSFEDLISYVMHVNAVGRGTALEKALQVAIQDIHALSQMAEAEILVITDGAAHLDLEKMRKLLGETIHVHTVKIGHASLVVDQKVIEDQIYQSNTDEAKALRQLFEKRKEAERQLNNTLQQKQKENFQSQVTYLNRQIESFSQKMAAQINTEYGHEMERLSEVFVTIDDLRPELMFCLPEEKIAELEELAEEMVSVLEESSQVEDMKKAAILYDHLMLLLKYNKIDAPRLRQAAQSLQNMLREIMETGEQHIGNEDLPIPPSEQEQLSHLLKSTMSKTSPQSLTKILRYWWLKLKRWISVFKQKLFRSGLYKSLNR